MNILYKTKQLVKDPIKAAMYAAASSGRDIRYAAAKVRYRADGNDSKPHFGHPREIGLLAIDPNANESVIRLPDNYLDLVDQIAIGTEAKLRVASEVIYYFGDKAAKRDYDAGKNLPACTWDTDVYREGRMKTIRSKECHHIVGIEELCRLVMPEVEKQIFNSYVEVASSFVERKFVPREYKPVELFHSDRHYEDTIRMIIYLNDVDEDTAPFEYLLHKETGKTVRIPTSDHPKLTMNGRIPDELVARYVSEGFERVPVVGKKGTIVLFDSKIIHKANIAKSRNRTVLVMPIRPALSKSERYVDPKNVEGVYV